MDSFTIVDEAIGFVFCTISQLKILGLIYDFSVDNEPSSLGVICLSTVFSLYFVVTSVGRGMRTLFISC